MRDLCIVPAFDRPEFLWLCLEHIFACPEVADIDVRVCLDRGHAYVSMADLVQSFPGPPELVVRPHHDYHGNSYNILMAYKQAVEEGRKYTFLVEDDVLVRPSFFKWHRFSQYIAPGITIASQQLNRTTYASIGVCWEHSALEAVIQHAVPAYFGNMVTYCASHFPETVKDRKSVV